MAHSEGHTDRQKIWDLIKGEHVAVLGTVGKDGLLDSRPMGCLQHEFDGTLWFMTFKDTPKLLEIERDQQALVSYSRPSDYEFVSLSGCARIVDEPARVKALWTEGLRVWFPGGPDSPNIALVAVDVETAKVWSKPASVLSYAFHYLRARLTGRSPERDAVAEIKTMQLKNGRHDVRQKVPHLNKR
jgi:general stress protein 26